MVVAIVGLLLGGILVPLAKQIEVSRAKEARSHLKDVRDAVYGFALANGRLPCPDCRHNNDGTGPNDCAAAGMTEQDGVEDRTGGVCAAEIGWLPGTDLGLSSFDPWGLRYMYRVTGTFADDTDGTGCGTATAGISFELCSNGAISIQNTIAAPPNIEVLATNIPALAYSLGANGAAEGWTPNVPGPPVSANENANWDDPTDGTSPDDNLYVDAGFSQREGSEFDDVVI